jgi:hypothetical protein
LQACIRARLSRPWGGHDGTSAAPVAGFFERIIGKNPKTADAVLFFH